MLGHDEVRDLLIKNLLVSNRIRKAPPMVREEPSKPVPSFRRKEPELCACGASKKEGYPLCQKHMDEVMSKKPSGCLALLAMAGLGALALVFTIVT